MGRSILDWSHQRCLTAGRYGPAMKSGMVPCPLWPRSEGSEPMESTVTTAPPADEAEVEAVLARLSAQMREVRGNRCRRMMPRLPV